MPIGPRRPPVEDPGTTNKIETTNEIIVEVNSKNSFFEMIKKLFQKLFKKKDNVKK